MKKYDYLLVGAGLFNAVFAYEAGKKGKKCLVIERRPHIGGNCYTEVIDDVIVHTYGAHIFRTDDESVWKYMQQFAKFNHFVNSPIARYKDEVYNLPFNMNTFSKLWGIRTPDEAREIIKKQGEVIKGEPNNLEEHAIKLVGTDIYEKLIKGYTKKQWGRECKDLPASIMRRIPLRFTYDNNYFNAPYQGIPIGGYTPIFEQMFEKADVLTGEDYLSDRDKWNDLAEEIIYTGTIDEYYEYKFGPLEYRSLRFETETLDQDNYQGVAVVNYTEENVPYTRIIEHKHFEFGQQEKTVISREYPFEWKVGIEPYYPINDAENTARYEKYLQLADDKSKVTFAGRLGAYQYTDMQDTVKAALKLANEMLEN